MAAYGKGRGVVWFHDDRKTREKTSGGNALEPRGESSRLYDALNRTHRLRELSASISFSIVPDTTKNALHTQELNEGCRNRLGTEAKVPTANTINVLYGEEQRALYRQLPSPGPSIRLVMISSSQGATVQRSSQPKDTH